MAQHPKVSVGPAVPDSARSQGSVNNIPVDQSKPAQRIVQTKNGNKREDR